MNTADGELELGLRAEGGGGWPRVRSGLIGFPTSSPQNPRPTIMAKLQTCYLIYVVSWEYF